MSNKKPKSSSFVTSRWGGDRILLDLGGQNIVDIVVVKVAGPRVILSVRAIEDVEIKIIKGSKEKSKELQ